MLFLSAAKKVAHLIAHRTHQPNEERLLRLEVAIDRLFADASGRGDIVFNVVAQDAVTVAEMGEAIRASIGADRVEYWPLDDARKSLGLFADALALDQTVSGQHARRVLAWEPEGPGVIADLSEQKHFQPINGL